MWRYVTALAMGVATVPFCLGDLPTNSDSLRFVSPKRIAPITPDGTVGRWVDYANGGITQQCATELVFDSIGAGGDYGYPCDPNILFLPGYCNALSLDDFTVRPGGEETVVERVAFMWRQSSGYGAESQLVVITTFEDMELSCTAPIASTGYGGVIFDFGLVEDGDWSADVDLCATGVSLQMPIDGNGGFTVVFAEEIPGTTFVLSTCAQPALLGTKDAASTGGVGTAPYSQNRVHYDDSNPPDGMIHPLLECFDYSFGQCVDPMGTAIAFYTQADPCAQYICADVNCDGSADAEDIDPFFLCLGGGGYPCGCKWFPCPCSICAADVNRSGGIDAEDVPVFFEALGVGGCP